MMLVPTFQSWFIAALWFYSSRPASLAVAKKETSREKADLEKRLKKAEETVARALDEAKEAKDEAKRLKKEIDKSKSSLKKSKEHSQKVESRFREVVGKLSGNFLLSILSMSFSDNSEPLHWLFLLICSFFGYQLGSHRCWHLAWRTSSESQERTSEMVSRRVS